MPAWSVGPAHADEALGSSWRARTVTFPDDDEGPVVATIVHRPGHEPTRPAVLYVHGYVDYFFHDHLAAYWEERGFDFYAVDLRKYGRSLRSWQTPNFCRDLREYWPDLDAAMTLIRQEHGHRTVMVQAHSTGGLIVSLWAHYRRERGPDAITLNSPWFDLNATWFSRTVLTAMVDMLGALRPRLVISTPDPSYGLSLHRSTGGVWEYDLRWKPLLGYGVYAGWIRAVRRGQARLARGLDIRVPIQVCCAARSGPNTRWHADLDSTDSVLDVRQIAARSVLLGPDVTINRIPNGIHDLALSAEPARRAYFDAVTRWSDGVLARLEEMDDIAAFDAAMAEEGPTVPWEQAQADMGSEG